MRENRLKAIWEKGDAVVNAWLHIPSAWSAEVMAHQGFDSLVIDMQHGMMGIDTAILMLQAISTTDAVPMVRVNWNYPGDIMKMLDAGAYGIICPMVDTREQCEQFVKACRYHPDGYRSLGPTRAKVYGGADYAQHANKTVLAIAMVETQEAMDNLEAIASTPGLDGIYVGPGDLRLSMFGKGGVDIEDPEFIEALDKIIDACKRNNIICGIHTNSTDYALRMVERGMQFVTIMTDTSMLTSTAARVVAEMRGKAVKERKATDAY